MIEDHLVRSRYLCGGTLTLSDICLFTTLIRFDLVYNVLFKCTKRKLLEYPNLHAYMRDIYQVPTSLVAAHIISLFFFLKQGVHCLYQNLVTSMFPLKVCRILSGACLFYDRFLRLQKLAILQPLWMVTTKYFFHWIQAAFNPSCLQVASTRSSPDLMTENRCHWQRVNL